jgi:E1-E2 ATPase
MLVVHCEELTLPGRGGGSFPVHANEDDLRVKIGAQVAELSGGGVPAILEMTRARVGGAAHAIAEAAESGRADVIVVGTRGHTSLECDEAVLTGESLPAEKRTDPITAPESSLDLASCAFMGTVVREGRGLGIVVCTAGRSPPARARTLDPSPRNAPEHPRASPSLHARPPNPVVPIALLCTLASRCPQPL